MDMTMIKTDKYLTSQFSQFKSCCLGIVCSLENGDNGTPKIRCLGIVCSLENGDYGTPKIRKSVVFSVSHNK